MMFLTLGKFSHIFSGGHFKGRRSSHYIFRSHFHVTFVLCVMEISLCSLGARIIFHRWLAQMVH